MGGRDFKLTNQRAIIMEFFKDNHDHPTVQETFQHVRKLLPQISKKTVYENLKFLVGIGVLAEVHVRGSLRYEPVSVPHHHAVCKHCSGIIDYPSEKLTAYSMRLAHDIKDFDVESASMVFYGTCASCRKKHDEI